MVGAVIEIDGSQGEGGGQIVRSSLALSLLTGLSFHVKNIRAGRAKPGLKRQHATAVNAAAKVGSANVIGAEVGSKELLFEPNQVRFGEFDFKISTAGSITLVLQTVLPALMMGQQSSQIRLSGGTHNTMAPPFDFLDRSFIPQLNKMGPQVDLKLDAWGFYPAGGGQFVAKIRPTDSMQGIELTQRGKLLSRRVRAIVSALPLNIATRETARVVRKLNWDRAIVEHVEVENPRGPGNILFAELVYENITVVFSGFGQQGVSAERVADAVVRQVKKYLKSDAPVGVYLADQLMLPMAIAAHFDGATGSFRTGSLSQHSITHADIIGRFLDVDVDLQTSDDGKPAETTTVSIGPKTED